MAIERTNTTSYEHPQETNLLNVHKAMEYNALGQPILRTTGDTYNWSINLSAGNDCSSTFNLILIDNT